MFQILKKSEFTKKFLIVTATKGSATEFFLKKPLGLFIEKSGLEKICKIHEFNNKGLPEIYNQYLTEEYKGKYILFIHDDVLIQDIFLFEKCLHAFENYDIIGLAGSKTCNLNSELTAWHLMTDKNNMVGEVCHSKNKEIWTTVFGPTRSRALIIDGLFIGVNVKKILEKNLKFDENFKFHHYDISFCLNSNKNELKIGVFPLSVIHFGLGDSMNTPEWIESNKKFKELYCNG